MKEKKAFPAMCTKSNSTQH